MPAFGLRSLPNLSSLFLIQLRTHVPDPGPECLRYLGVGPWLCFLGTWPWSVALPLLLLLLPHMMGRRVTHIMERRITRNRKCLRKTKLYLDCLCQEGYLYTGWLSLAQNGKRPLEQE